MTKYIFVSGGVVSGLGKGITSASIGALLKASGYKVFMQKFDPYLNIDPGTLSPYQHGEVFVTEDGAETDLDLGHYERFINENLNKFSNITSGKIYQKVIRNERAGLYGGKTVQVIPHITNEIKQKVYDAGKSANADIVITEIGGTIGDIESLPFLEAARQVRREQGKNNTLFMHVSLVPILGATAEVKTKPTQHSVKELLSLGIQPDIIVARCEEDLSKDIKEKIAMFCNVNNENILVAKTEKSIYYIPEILYKQNAHKIVANILDLKIKKTNIEHIIEFNNKRKNSKEEIVVDIIGKYVELPDAYLSIIESLKIAGYEIGKNIKINWIKAENINKDNYNDILKNSKGILIPGGFGERGFEGKILAIKFARENNIPFFGICFGMQAAAVEFARNVCGLKNAGSLEFGDNKDNIIDIMAEQKNLVDLGGTLRLGNYKTTLSENSLAQKLYNANFAIERHRHRYEFSNKYRSMFEKNGISFSGIYAEKDLVEIIELPKHKFFIATQYHPEFTSRLNKPNPLFLGFVKAIK
ncbi:CTP synthase [Spiroplasma endosymbiont of Anurida maritima]|uniref:CTP synthase n=1 Tax=Spiroplasma endosymbiont of Anurida maritima TaxID=2967972 RepID=UPI0036D36968